MKNPAWLKDKKVVIVADWLTTYGGAEKVVKTVSEIFPEAPIYTSQYSKKNLNWFDDKDIRTGWMNLFPPFLRKILPVFRSLYFSNLDLSEFDVILSITTAESKGLRINKNQLHISYLQGPPTQYYWGMYDKYIENPGFGKLNFIVRFFFKLLVKPLRKSDYKYAQRPDFLLANSTYSADEIKQYYERKSEIIFPPVETSNFSIIYKKQNYFISTSRQVNWKRLDLAVKACVKTDEKLILIGNGAEHEKLIKLAKGNEKIIFLPRIEDSKELAKLVGESKGFIFPSVEPFGIAPIEALSAGTPVIALRKGGSLDYIKDAENGIFFKNQTEGSLISAIQKFKKTKFKSEVVSRTAHNFSKEKFIINYEKIIKENFNEKF